MTSRLFASVSAAAFLIAAPDLAQDNPNGTYIQVDTEALAETMMAGGEPADLAGSVMTFTVTDDSFTMGMGDRNMALSAEWAVVDGVWTGEVSGGGAPDGANVQMMPVSGDLYLALARQGDAIDEAWTVLKID